MRKLGVFFGDATTINIHCWCSTIKIPKCVKHLATLDSQTIEMFSLNLWQDFMAEILPIRHKSQFNQSINHCKIDCGIFTMYSYNLIALQCMVTTGFSIQFTLPTAFLYVGDITIWISVNRSNYRLYFSKKVKSPSVFQYIGHNTIKVSI